MAATVSKRRLGGAALAIASMFVLALALHGQQPADAPQQPPTAAVPVAPAADGPTLFHERGCEYCHSANAAGSEKAPSLRNVRKQLSKAAIAHQIHDGGGGMPAFGDALSTEEINNLVAYLETLKPLPRTRGGKQQSSPKPAAAPMQGAQR